jgi:sugar phosphate permease
MNSAAHFPLSPKRWPFFYGWFLLPLAGIGVLMSVPGQTIGVSVFTDYLIDALSLSRSTLSIAYMIGTISSALFLSAAGRLYDRKGARLVTSIAAFGLGAVLLYLSFADRIAAGIAALLPPRAASVPAFVLVLIGFFGIRFFGQGVLTMSSRNMAMKWFERRRGLAIAVIGISISFGFSYSPRVIEALIDLWGWRSAWRFLALIVGAGFLLIAAVFYRDSPEECGLLPDGGPGKKTGKKATHAPSGDDFSLKEARKTYPFWIIIATLTLFSMIITAFTFHVVSIFKMAGYGRDIAVGIFFPASLISVTLQFGGSILSDYLKIKYYVMVNLAGLLITLIAIYFLPSGSPRWLLIVGLGIIQGVFGIVSSITWPRYYGLKHLGAITGFVFAWQVGGSAVGPYFFSLSKDLTGGYGAAALISFILTAAVFAGSFFIVRPAKKAGLQHET